MFKKNKKDNSAVNSQTFAVRNFYNTFNIAEEAVRPPLVGSLIFTLIFSIWFFIQYSHTVVSNPYYAQNLGNGIVNVFSEVGQDLQAKINPNHRYKDTSVSYYYLKKDNGKYIKAVKPLTAKKATLYSLKQVGIIGVNITLYGGAFFAVTFAFFMSIIILLSKIFNRDFSNKINRGSDVKKNEEYLEYVKEHRPEELQVENEWDYFNLMSIYKTDIIRNNKKLFGFSNEYKEIKFKWKPQHKDGKKVLYKKTNFIDDAKGTEARVVRMEEIGSLKLTIKDMFDHSAVVGSTGSGKSKHITDRILEIERRQKHFAKVNPEKRKKMKCIILDMGEEFTQTFYKDGWKRVNPLAEDGYYVNWFDYVKSYTDINEMTNIISGKNAKNGGENAEFWNATNEGVFKGAFASELIGGAKTNQSLIDVLELPKDEYSELMEESVKKVLKVRRALLIKLKEIEDKLKDLHSEHKEISININNTDDISLKKKLVAQRDDINIEIASCKKDKKMMENKDFGLKKLASLCSKAKGYVKDKQGDNVHVSFQAKNANLEYLGLYNKTLNLDDYLLNDGDNLIVSLPYDNRKIGGSYAGSFFELLANKLLTLGKDNDREIYLIIDEFTNIDRIDSLIDLITMVRKFNVNVTLGFQEASRIEENFSKEQLESFENNLVSWFIFQLNSATTQEFAMKMVGKQELEESLLSANIGVENNKDGVNINRQVKDKNTKEGVEFKALSPNECLFVRKSNSHENEIGNKILTIANLNGCVDFDKVADNRTSSDESLNKKSKLHDSLKIHDFNELVEELNVKLDDETTAKKTDSNSASAKSKEDLKQKKKEEILKKAKENQVNKVNKVEENKEDLSDLDDFLEDLTDSVADDITLPDEDLLTDSPYN